jgi:hypothetical protein
VKKLSKLCTALAGALIVSGLALSASAAPKPKCPRTCRTAVSACRTAVPLPSTCTGTPAEKRKCKRDIAKTKKLCLKNILKTCRSRSATVAADVCSPSGAFLDPTL